MKFFITGTDTEVGKTYISVQLLKYFNALGLKTIGIKPVASGANWCEKYLRNDDALALQKNASIELPYELVNPFVYEPPIAPHIAASKRGETLTAEKIYLACSQTLQNQADIYIIEGAGGWYTPLNHHETMADFVVKTGAKIILVVGLRLGCLNHALLTYRSIESSGQSCIGWIANMIHPNMENIKENLETLNHHLPIPCLSVVEYQQDAIKF